MRIITLVTMITLALMCGCSSDRPKMAVKAGTNIELVKARNDVAVAKKAWMLDRKNIAKRQAYDNAVTKCMEKTGKTSK